MDKLSSDPQQLKEKCEHVEEVEKDAIQKEQFTWFVLLECHQLSKKYVQPLTDLLIKSLVALSIIIGNRKCLSSVMHLLHSLFTNKVKKTSMTVVDFME